MTVANGIPALRPHLSLGVLVSPVQDQAVTCRYRKVSKKIPGNLNNHFKMDGFFSRPPPISHP